MPSKQLYSVWAVLDLMLLAAGGITIAFSVIWQAPDVLRNLVVSNTMLTAGLVLGIAFCIAVVFSIGGVVQPNHVTLGLTIFNYVLMVVSIITITVGSSIWFWTLRETENFTLLWLGLEPEKQGVVQDALRCCGWLDKTDSFFNQGFCAAPPADVKGCFGPLLAFADNTLMNVFTTIYGFMAILVALILANMCVINKRLERERFRKIDAKRGGRGFV
jgi:hypothetical protein